MDDERGEGTERIIVIHRRERKPRREEKKEVRRWCVLLWWDEMDKIMHACMMIDIIII